MRSEHIIDEIQAYIDGELRMMDRRRVRRHLEACDDCRVEYATLRTLNATLRLGDPIDETAAPSTNRRPSVGVRFAMTAAMVIVVTLIVFMMPHKRHYPDPNAAIAAALSGVDTWHFSGWKQINGKRVPWQIWGRRAPYYSYERVGDDIITSDGKVTRRILAPDPALGRPTGLVVDTPTNVGLDFDAKLLAVFSAMTEPEISNMVDWHWQQGGGMFMDKPFRQTSTEMSYRRQWYRGGGAVNQNRVFTISKRSWLPLRYEFNSNSAHGNWNTAYLAAHYDEDIPDDVLQTQPPGGYTAVDFVHATLTKLNYRTYRYGPFDLTGKVVAVDADGDAIVEIVSSLGGRSLTSSDKSSFTVNTSFDPDTLIVATGTDGRSHQYVNTINMFGSMADGGAPYLLLPLDGPAQVDRLNISPTFGLSLIEHDIDAKDEFGRDITGTRYDQLATGHLPMSLSLSDAKHVQALDASMPADWKRELSMTSLARKICQQKAEYLDMSSAYQYTHWLRHRKEYAPMIVKPSGEIDLTKPVPYQKMLDLNKKYAKEMEGLRIAQERQAIYWQRRSLALVRTLPLSRRNEEASDDYRVIAWYCHKAGDVDGMRDALRKQLSIFRKMYPPKSTLVRQVEYELKTGSLAGEADYHGPS